MSTIKEILKPANRARDIVLNVGADKTTDPAAAYSELEYQAGFYWPMVKVRNTTFTKPNIRTFDIDFGYNLIPRLDFTIIDDNKSFQQNDYPVKNDIVTVYLGNQYDQESKPIHLDFLIDDVSTFNKYSGTPEHSFSCSLAIEHQFENMNFASEVDSIGVLMELCKKMKLGFVTNLNTTEDFQKYRQFSKTNIEFLKDVCSKVYVDDKAIIHYFIDQYFRLNVIDVNQVLQDVAEEKEVTRDITFFRVLDKKEKLILNNAQYNLDNVQFKFGKYRQQNKAFDSYKEIKPIDSTVIVKDYKSGTVKSTFKSTKNQSGKGTGKKDVTANNVTESKQVQAISTIGEDNPNIKQVGDNANKSRYTYLNNNSIFVTMVNPSNQLNINQLVPVKLYNNDQFTTRPFKNSDKNLESSLEVPSYDGTEVLNESLSSDYAIHAMSFGYRQGQNLWQELKLVRKEWKKQFYDEDGLEIIDMSDTTFGAPDPYTIPPLPPPPPVDSSGYGGGYGGSLGNWMEIARGELGQKEVPGAGSNPRIEEYHKVGGGLSGSNVNDSVAWCGSFVGWCMVKAGYPKASGAAAAISWANYGTACAPGTIGAIIVMKLKPSSMTYSGNHVGFCAGLSGDKVSILGGNQGDSVSQMNMSASKVIAWRLPPGGPSPGIANAGNSVAPTGPLRITDQGINFIKNREGCKLTAYWDSYGKVWTIGYGHTKTARQGMTITYQQAEILLRQDIVYFENYINKNIKVKMTQMMFDALVSLIFNTGPGKASPSSKIGRFMAARQYQSAADTFLQYVTSKGVRLEGLVTRRQAERQMFLSQGVNPI